MALWHKLITTLETALFFWNFFFFAIKNLHKISPCIYILVLLEEIDNISSLTDQMSIYDHQFSKYIGAYIITFLNVNGENSVAKPGKIWCTQMHGKLNQELLLGVSKRYIWNQSWASSRISQTCMCRNCSLQAGAGIQPCAPEHCQHCHCPPRDGIGWC